MGLDNGRGVLMGACIITMVNAAGPRSFSIIYVELMDKYQSSAAATAGIGSLLAGAQLFAGSLAAIVSNRYSYKTAVLLGVAFRASGYILSSFAPSITYLYLTLGIITGIGGALCQNSAMMIVGQSFDKFRARAFGLTTAFAGVGTFIFPILTQWFLKHFGFEITMCYLAAKSTLVLFAAGLFGRHESLHLHEIGNPSKKKGSIDWSLIFEPYFGLFCVIIGLTFMGNSMTISMLPALSNSYGIGKTYGAYLLSAFGLTSMVAVLFHGAIYDSSYIKPRRKLLYALYILLSGYSSFLAARGEDSYLIYMVSAILFGIANSSTMSQRVTMLGDMVDVLNLPGAIAILGIFQGIGLLSGPLLAGTIRDIYGSYNAGYYVASMITTVAGGGLMLNYCTDDRRKDDSTLH